MVKSFTVMLKTYTAIVYSYIENSTRGPLLLKLKDPLSKR